MPLKRTGAPRGSGTGLLQALGQPRAMLGLLRQYATANFGRSREPVGSRDALRAFLESRASFVAQTSLYGYLRTRAGMRYPELFDDDAFVASINVAKWQLWLACLSDLAVYAGGLLRDRSGASPAQVGALMGPLVDEILDATGVPPDAGGDFASQAQAVRARVALCDWAAVSDDDQPFSQSPDALVRWAPVIDELKQLDAPIVRNSVRFRWQEVRRHLRRSLDARAILAP